MQILSGLFKTRTKFYTNKQYNQVNQIKRELHRPSALPENVKKIVVFANNSGLFTTLSAIKEFGSKAYPGITVVCPDFWIDKVHSDYLRQNWGQTIYGLPHLVRKIFLDYRPNYPDDKFIEWGEYQQVRKLAMEELKTFSNTTFYKGNPIIVEPNDTGFDIGINDQIIKVPRESLFYLWYRESKVIPPIVNSHIKLYEMPIRDVPKTVIVIGHGVSIIWLLRHYPNTNFIVLKRPDEELPQIPGNRDVDIEREKKSGRLKIYLSQEVILNVDETGTMGALIDKKSNMLLHEGHVFSAAGFVPNHKILSSVPEDRKLLMPNFQNNPKDLHSFAEKEIKRLSEDIFVAPQNIPFGSLTHSYTLLMNITDNISWTSEPMFYFRKSQYDFMMAKGASAGIKLDIRFFEALDDEIGQLENPMDLKHSIDLYIKVFEQTQKPTAAEMIIFRKLLDNMFVNENDEKPNISPSFKF